MNLSKSRSIYHRTGVEVNLSKSRSIYHRIDTSPNYVLFGKSVDSDEFRPVMDLTIDLWDDMGCPDTITVSIEPGDLLNA